MLATAILLSAFVSISTYGVYATSYQDQMPFATSQGKKSLPGTVGSTAKGAAVSGRFSPTGGGVGTPKSQERSVPGSGQLLRQVFQSLPIVVT
jgi:hypothetical protein